MKKLINIAVVLAVIVLNAVAIVPGFFSKPAPVQDKPVAKQARVQVTDVTSVLLPSLVRL